MIHLQFRVVLFPFLRVFRGHMKINVTQVPPGGKALAEINPSPGASDTGNLAIEFKFARIGRNDHGLNDPQGVSINAERVGRLQLFKGARGIVVLHPVHINANVEFFAFGQGAGSLQVNGTFVVHIASIVGAPNAKVHVGARTQIPASTVFPLVWPARLLL